MVKQTDKRIDKAKHRDDFGLAQRVAAGDITAWEQLYREAYPKVERYAVKIGGHMANELVSDAFDTGYFCIGNFRGKSRFSTWISGILYHQLMDHYQQTTRAEKLKTKLICMTSYYTAIDPLDAMLLTERNRCVWRAFSILPELHRVLIERRVLLKESYREIAQSLGLGLGETIREYKRGLKIMKYYFIRFYEITPTDE